MNERTLARFFGKVDKNGPISGRRPDLGPCWIWKPLAGAGGYGWFTDSGKTRLAHRAAYELLVAPIPPGLTIDHLCFVRQCVNPSHLEAVTLAENVRRAKGWEAGAAFNRNKTRCPAGHPYSGRNLAVRSDGSRHCRECQRLRVARRRARLRLENPPVPAPPKEACGKGHLYAVYGSVGRDGRRYCGECSRRKVREYRARQRQKWPKEPRLTCKHGHPWARDNIYVNPRTGQRACRACHNERSLARYHRLKVAAPPKAPRETCKHGHPWTPENIYVTPHGLEKCRECARVRNRRHGAKKRAAKPPKAPRTHCRCGLELAGDNLYVSPGGRKFCRACMARRSAEGRDRRREAGITSPAKSRRQTHCKRGHEMTPENTYTAPDGSRKCRECLNRRTREFMRRKRAS